MKTLLLLSALLVACVSGIAMATDQTDIAQYTSCQYCGMDRQKFAHSRMLIEYADNSSVGLCSLHCAALDLANQLDKMPAAIKVGNYNTKKLINAESATWVLGGKVKGVMTGRAKWAFANKDEAMKFVAENGGDVVDFEAAISAAYQDMYQDTRMIRQKRQEMKKMKM
ncbi:MAG: NosL family protein [Desulfurivibrio sp.]|nr:NosL family protein [Desulfurivibrio sp.]MBU4034097.1 nitrous oxide reductase accessory protein NosL [Pseudomonadota bacterium]MBU4117877.1 nitrous oxide reductase accessory protein NosL [Pseudomonadota bacterium]